MAVRKPGERFTNNFRYKNFGLLIELQYSYGNDVMDMTTHSSEDRVSLANSYRTVLKRGLRKIKTHRSQNYVIQEPDM